MRRQILENQVTYYGVRGDSVGYIYLKGFTDKSAQEVKNAFEDLKKNHHIKSLILDLRNNGGGLLESATQIVGIAAKMPSLLYLYPENAYFEYININELTNENIPESQRLFMTTTEVRQVDKCIEGVEGLAHYITILQTLLISYYIQIGVRYDHTSVVGGIFSPRVNASIDLIPNLLSLQGGYGIAAKMPPTTEV